jgi:5-methylcytosine-specific restriction endonuclease McrA
MAKIFDRNNARATAANPDGKQRGPNGRRLCRWCGTEVTPPRRTFCGDDCVHEWSVRSSAAYARTKVWERDKGVCALCGVNTAEQRKHLREEFEVQGFRQQPSAEKSKAFYARLRALKISASRWITADHQGCWDVDHATPVVEGGGSCGLDNLRTLCLRCHHQQTRRLRQRQRVRRARKRLGCYEID